ncbi:MAG: hypothetical protein ACAI38_02600 [Myxococcota bacterium]
MRSHLVPLLVALVASVVLSVARCAHVAAQADFETVAAAVRSAYREGDLIVVTPFHQATPRTLLGDLPLIEPRRVEPQVLRMHPRLLVVAVDAVGALREELEALGSVAPVASAGRVHAVAVTVREPVQPTLALRERLADVQVLAHYGGTEPTACSRWNGSRWSCPRDSEWSWVGRATLNLEDGPRACVWMHPLNGGRELTLTLPETSGSRLLLGHGFVLSAATRAPVQVEVRRGEAKLFSGEVMPRTGWEYDVVDLDRGSGPIVLAVKSRDNGGAHFCADAWVLP